MRLVGVLILDIGNFDSMLQKLTVISNYTMKFLRRPLEQNLGNTEISILDDGLILANLPEAVASDGVVVCFDGIGVSKAAITGSGPHHLILKEAIRQIDTLASSLRDVPLQIILLPSLSLHAALDPLEIGRISELNTEIRSALETAFSSAYFLDADTIVRQIGIEQAFNFREFVARDLVLAPAVMKPLANALVSIIDRINGRQTKLVIFDLDNTLWRGVLGEDGKEGIRFQFGDADNGTFAVIHRWIRDLTDCGVITAVCSKNNLHEVQELLADDCIDLKSEDFAIIDCGWGPKGQRVKKILEIVNIDASAAIFVDDSIMEIEDVSATNAGIKVLHVDTDPIKYLASLRAMVLAAKPIKISTEDKAKNQMIREAAARHSIKSNYATDGDYIEALAIEVEFLVNDIATVPRVAQMSQKTNQFNMTTTRLTDIEVERQMKSTNTDIIALKVRDKFGEYGLTGMASITTTEERLIVTNFLLSCRVLGRGVEQKVLDFILEMAAVRGMQQVEFLFVQSLKNEPAKTFWQSIGGQRSGQNGVERIVLGV